MLIRRMTATFGKLSQETLELSEGLNILQAPNESGKSTWSAFLLSMFYGINSRERDRAGFIADKNRYAPWSGVPMSGRLECRTDSGAEITLTRETRRQAAPMGEFQALYAGTGEAVPGLTGTSCGETLLGVSREVYERSAFIRQAGLPISQDAGLEKRIAALITSGEEEVSYSEAADALKKQLNRRRHNKTGQLPALEAERGELCRQLETLDLLHSQLSQAQGKAEALSARESDLAAQMAQHDRWDAFQSRRAVREAENAARAAQERADRLRRGLEEERIPENETIARLRGAIVNLETVRKSVDRAMAEKDDAMKVRLRAEAAVSDSPFVGQTPEEARQEVQSPPAVKAACPGFPVLVVGALLAAACGFLLYSQTDPSPVPAWLKAFPFAAALAILAAAGGVCVLMNRRALRKAQTAALLRRFGTAEPAALSELAEAYAVLCQKRDDAQAASTAATAAYSGLYNSLISNEQAILLEVRRSAPAAFDISAADAALRSFAQRRKELLSAEAAAREAALRLEYQRQSTPQAPEDGEPVMQPLQSRESLEQSLADVRRELAASRSTADRLSGQIAALGDRAVLQAQSDRLAAQTQSVQAEYDAIALALETLDLANADLQNRFSPALGRRTAEIFSALTGNAYGGVVLDRSFRLSVEPAGSPVYRDAQLLSAGASDQLYLAARLAICQMVLPFPVPIVLDDALANFDDERCAAALRWLKEESSRRQILLFTCHSREADFFRGDSGVSVRELTAQPSGV